MWVYSYWLSTVRSNAMRLLWRSVRPWLLPQFFLSLLSRSVPPWDVFPWLKSESRPDHNPDQLLSLIKVPFKCRMSKIAAALLVLEERPEGCFCRLLFHVECENGLLVVQTGFFNFWCVVIRVREWCVSVFNADFWGPAGLLLVQPRCRHATHKRTSAIFCVQSFVFFDWNLIITNISWWKGWGRGWVTEERKGLGGGNMIKTYKRWFLGTLVWVKCRVMCKKPKCSLKKKIIKKKLLSLIRTGMFK